MPRIRTIKPEFFAHPEITALSFPARLLLIALLTQADDEGRLLEQRKKIDGNSFGETDDADVCDLLDELEKHDRIVRYEADGKRLIQVLNFDKHQTINRPTKSSYISPSEASLNGHASLPDDSLNTHGDVTEDSLEEGKGREGKGEHHDAARLENDLPLKAVDGQSLSETQAKWWRASGVSIPSRQSRAEAYRAVLGHTDNHLGEGHKSHRFICAEIISDAVCDGAGEEIPDAAKSHLRRLVKTHGPIESFDAMMQGVIWGAGIDPKYGQDALALTKYATAVLEAQKKERESG